MAYGPTQQGQNLFIFVYGHIDELFLTNQVWFQVQNPAYGRLVDAACEECGRGGVWVGPVHGEGGRERQTNIHLGGIIPGGLVERAPSGQVGLM